MNLLIQDAWAQSAGGGSGGLLGLLPLVLMFVIFYFLLIRPQQKKTKDHRAMVADLSKGDEVVTVGGLLGKITDLDENFIMLEVADGLQLRVQRFSVAQMMPRGTFKSNKKPKPAKPAKSTKDSNAESS